ncbi:MAG: hypothetical protein ABIP94_12655 [Planctomycetota bacterium]
MAPIAIFAAVVAPGLLAQRPNLAANPTGTGVPNSLQSDPGWGGGALPWEIIDSQRNYAQWYHGLAFTGGNNNWAGQPAGPRQATINFGTNATFSKVVLWHHGHDSAPALASTSQLAYFDGTTWTNITAARTYGRQDFGGGWSVSDEYEFFPVTGSKVRWSFDNSQLSMIGTQITHGWLYEFEVFAPQPSLAVNTTGSGFPNALQSDPGWGGGSYPWEIVDGQRTYSQWYHGLALTGGSGPWIQPAGPRQVTIDFGANRTFAKVILWHHGVDHAPALTSTSQLAYFNGTAWVNLGATRTFGRMQAGGAGSTSDEYEFFPVTGSKVRWSFDNTQLSMTGAQITHGWLYEFEVFAASTQSSFGTGCAGSNGVPVVVPTPIGPRLSEDFVLTFDSLPANPPVFGVLGFSNTQANGTPLPLSLGFLGMPGCQLLVSNDLVVPVTARPSPTTAAWTTPIPNLQGLLGLEFFQQLLVLDLGVNALGLTTSNASRATIGWN